jgi:protoheme IX farnesyltransferase
MKATTMQPALTPVARPAVLTRSRIADYVELTKPRIALLVLFTVIIGAFLAGGVAADVWLVFHTVLGTTLVAAGASALNQYLERRPDSRMRRTQRRPLPSGRLRPFEALAFGVSLGIVGIIYLAALLPHMLAAVVAAVTFLTYVFVYTPLKRITTLNTLVGAVPGALPPLIGWAAVRGTIDMAGVGLFLIIFFWQVPHFLAIAWIYREDYARGGFQMLPVADRDGGLTARNMVLYCLALVPASLIPFVTGVVGAIYLIGAVVLGLLFLASTIGFWREANDAHARRVLRGSLIYLPAIMMLLLVDGLYHRFF